MGNAAAAAACLGGGDEDDDAVDHALEFTVNTNIMCCQSKPGTDSMIVHTSPPPSGKKKRRNKHNAQIKKCKHVQ